MYVCVCVCVCVFVCVCITPFSPFVCIASQYSQMHARISQLHARICTPCDMISMIHAYICACAFNTRHIHPVI
jgi:hypothetical protein